MVKVNLDTKAIEKTATDVFREVCYLQGLEFVKVITEPGAFDGFPDQDIVDKENLRASQALTFPRPDIGTFTWSVEYGIFVRFGYQTRSGTEVKGRDWVALGLERYDFEGALAKLLAFKLK
jgi:hypothetical protein